MKTLISTLLVSATAWVHADYTTPFTAPPFEMETSIVGREGWEPRNPGPPAPDMTARMVALRWDQYRPALLLEGASIKNGFPATTGSQVRVTVTLALTFPSEGPPLQQVRIIIGNAPFQEIVFEGNANGGLGFGNGSSRGTRVVVPFDQLKPNAFYTMTVLVNYDTSTYDVTVTGENREGKPLRHEEKGIGFTTQTPSLKGVLILSTKNVRTYLRQLLIESL